MTAPLSADEDVRPNPACLLTELGDGTGVLLDLGTKFYFTLNETGVFVWKALVAAEHGAASSLGRALTSSFDVTEPAAVEDALTLLRELSAAGLVARK